MLWSWHTTDYFVPVAMAGMHGNLWLNSLCHDNEDDQGVDGLLSCML